MKMISAEELKKRLKNDEILLIDVREEEEYAAERIEGSSLIPLGTISLEKLPTLSKPIVIHCRSGKRSEAACKKLLAEDPNLDVSSLEGGIEAWKKLSK